MQVFRRGFASSRLKELREKLKTEVPFSKSPIKNEIDLGSCKVENKTFFIETLGCQMNVADSEIVGAVMQGAGFSRIEESSRADVVLLNTCAIRENAEERAIQKLQVFKSRKCHPNQLIGVLGCMAERLKEKLLVNNLVNVVVGPDSYRNLPKLLQIANAEEHALDVQLSVEETYADVVPVRMGPGWQAFISISRGCNNMCSYCIVPFTRGRERSRDVDSICKEMENISKQGTIREVVLLGQNVNSYHFKSKGTEDDSYGIASGFTDLYKSRRGGGTRFHDLLDKVASIDKSIRIRFTSPHPKDFTDDVLHVIKKHSNICKGIHLPAQSGSSSVLSAMRRGYTREAYLQLVERARTICGPELEFSSDFISGFCGETEEDHQQTLELLKTVKYAQAFTFAYSVREKTKAFYRLQDDVPHDVKLRRLQEVIDCYRNVASELALEQIGKVHTVLVEGPSKRDKVVMQGRTDGLRRCIILPSDEFECKPGDYVEVQVLDANAASMSTKLIRKI